ncbi:hypothetical protein MTQ10_29555 [Streptomyces sp. XM83C]|uniref:Uncharacterized protein n=1 Tax=Streptomyces thermocoprophilus TaxID=78356 RepID=A0ABV5VMX1_9ACTN|nr:hypothetical protein [Streptomyces sp. XM83C]MCK1823618.1 hypothetical protein [Streptomyces sp. XM83C]
MGIRMLHRRTARAKAHEPAAADADAAPRASLPTVPPYAPAAGTARIPSDPLRALTMRAARLGRRIAGHGRAVRDALRLGDAAVWRARSDVVLGFLALLTARLPRPRPTRTFTVFVMAPLPTGGPGLSDRPDRPGRRPH